MALVASRSPAGVTYHYRAFGLNISSELAIRNWPVGEPPWDVHVRWGEVPATLDNSETLWDGRFWGRKGMALLSYPDVGRMVVTGGDTVSISLGEDGNSEKLAYVLGSTGMTALIYQRGDLCLHASAVAQRGVAILIMGPSGAGKSTLVSALADRGCAFVSDDVTRVTRHADGRFFATPSFPAIRLRHDSHAALALGEKASGAYDPIDEKFRLHYGGSIANGSLPIGRICFLEADETIATPHAAPIHGQERVSALQRSLFRRSMARIIGDPQRFAALTIALAQRTEVVRITRPKRRFAIDELCALALA